MSTDAILKAIDVEHKAKCQSAWDAYDARMKQARIKLDKAKRALASAERVFRAHERGADASHKQAIQEAQQWRTEARQAAAGDRPAKIADIAVVRHVTRSGIAVSLPRIGCLDGAHA